MSHVVVCMSGMPCDVAGIISVIGISFTFLPIAQKSIALMTVRSRWDDQRTAANCKRLPPPFVPVATKLYGCP